MSWTANSCFVTVAILFLWRVQEIAEACSCSAAHPQQAFCNSDVGLMRTLLLAWCVVCVQTCAYTRKVIRARVVSQEQVDAGNDVYGNPIKRIKYGIKQIKMFKGPDQDIEAIYTAPSSAQCGVTLETNGRDYLITGKLEADGTVHITLCNFIMAWESTSATQKKSLTQHYAMGCDCRITRCTSVPCAITGPAECLWLDWVIERTVNGQQAQHFACIKRNDDSCAWYRGAAPPKRDFLDIEDP